jgi:glutamyl-tRNA synthetase
MGMKEDILLYALENALKFSGKANPGAVVGKILSKYPKLKSDMKSLSSDISKIIKDVNAMSLESQQKAYDAMPKEMKESKEQKKKEQKEHRHELPDLPDAVKGKVVTRIPPEPSKYAHIGHALSFLINYMYAKKYDGKCLLKFEDTNPEKCKKEFADAMEDDILNYLEIDAEVIYISDHMDYMYSEAEKLIKMGKAYVCLCNREEMQDHRHKGEECCHCSAKPEEVMMLWKQMLAGKYKAGDAVLRLKADMKADNQVMRDPVMFRISFSPHFRHGEKYCVWPLYDFENSVMDCKFGVTHVLRSSEFGEMRNELQAYIKKLLGFEPQTVVHYGRFNIRGSVSQGREIRQMIEQGKVEDWDDPSLVTLKALRRKGIVKETLIELVYQVGLSLTQTNIDWTVVEALNRSILDKRAKRFFFIDDPKEIKIKGAPIQDIDLKLHPEEEERPRHFETGESFYVTSRDHALFEEGKIIRLMDCLNFVKDDKGFKYHSLEHEEFKGKGNLIIHWLPAEKTDLVHVDVRMPDSRIASGICEPLVRKCREGDIVQFARFGFCRLDKIEKDKLIFWFTTK